MAAINMCVGVKANGDVCGKRCQDGNTRCATHLATVQNYGPNTLAQKELGYIHKKQIRDIKNRFQELLIDARDDAHARTILIQDEADQIRILKANQRREMTLLIRRQDQEIRRTGIDPDQAARDRNLARQQQRAAEWRERMELVNQVVLQHRMNNEVAAMNNLHNANMQRQAPPVGDLERFARDAQNIHTTVAVKQTKDMVSRILKIVVPTEFRWNAHTCSKTPGEIINECSLSARGAWQMVSKYCQDEDIYDMGKGIYGKVLDGVWQYVATSPDKADLCRILRQEMEDNIGMCAQGNLTRLCNILAGYMEGIGVQESPSEILGRKLPKLMQIEDENIRIQEAHKLLVETGIPSDQWMTWVEPLVERSISLKVNAGGEIIGLQLV